MLRILCLITGLFLLIQPSFAENRHTQTHPVELTIKNSSNHVIVVQEGWVIRRTEHLEPLVGSLVQHEWFGHIGKLKVEYLAGDGNLYPVHDCPDGFYYYSLIIEVREDDGRGLYCHLIDAS